MNSLEVELRRRFGEAFRANQNLHHHSTLRTGGLAKLYLELSSAEKVAQLQRFSREKGVPYATLGRGSNLIIQDEPIEQLVVRLAEPKNNLTINGTQVTFSASCSLQKAIRWAQSKNLVGMEFATGIPGTIGGAVKMNAGTKLGEASNVLQTATLLQNGEQRIVRAETLGFNYRTTNLDKETIVWDATFELSPAEQSPLAEAKSRSKAYLEYRLATQPIHLPNVGSVFKNPSPKTPSAQLIEKAGLKGKAIGGVQISNKHANFIVNTGNATANNAWSLIHLVQEKVYGHFRIQLEPEVVRFPA